MDSGNSGSMQSSSGGDEEFDSRTESISPFLTHPSTQFGSITNPHPPPPPPLPSHNHPSTMFDPPPHNLGAFSHTPPNPNPNANTLYNLDLVWSRGLRSDPNYSDIANLAALSASSSSSSTSLSSLSLSSSNQSLLAGSGPIQAPFPSSSSSVPLGRADQHQQPPPNATKNSKKRTRASRRAPTTVLTTDTTNFRQMVQEFTGIPAPPFSASPYSRRLDLFGAGSTMRSGHLEPLGSFYSLRPSVPKGQPSSSSSSSPSLLNSAALIDGLASNTSNINSLSTSISGTSNSFNSSNFQLPSDLALLPKQHQNMLTMQNPNLLSFQSLLQSSPLPPPLKYPFSVSPPKPQGGSALPSLEELGISHEHAHANLGGFQSHGGHDWQASASEERR